MSKDLPVGQECPTYFSMLTFANSLGWWALLGIPAVIAIHFLQRRSRRQTVTTLFLLRQMRRESETGNRFERLRTSIPLWLQLLMVMVLAWLLLQPRWLKEDAVRRVAIVLDSSASMTAYRESAEAAVAMVMDRLVGPVARAELSLLPSDMDSPALYHGGSGIDLKRSMGEWKPLLGVHDFSPALRAARGLVGPKGMISDHVPADSILFDARWVSVGEPLANVGWTGVTLEEKDGQWIWRALVRNYSDAVQAREWRVLAGGAGSPPTRLELKPRETRSLSGPFPEGESGARITLRLSDDAFVLDDALPLVRPAPKQIGFSVLDTGGDERAASDLAELFSRFPHTREVAVPVAASVNVGLATPGVVLPEGRHGCYFLRTPSKTTPALKGNILAEAHPLMDGLNWQGLIARDLPMVEATVHDRVLLWQGDRPLILLREMPAGGRQLIFEFDLESSNARRLPALAILLHRFLDTLRKAQVMPESANFDVRQRLELAWKTDAPVGELRVVENPGMEGEVETELLRSRATLARAPSMPGFFEVWQNEVRLLEGAAHFADAREADLSAAKPFDGLPGAIAEQAEVLYEADPRWRLWLLGLLAALLGSWWFTRERAGELNKEGKVGAAGALPSGR